MPDNKYDRDINWLNKALAHLHSVSMGLDISGSTCECCGLNSKHNWQEAQWHKQLSGAIGRVRTVMSEMKGE